MAIVETVTTLTVFGLAAGIWFFDLHLDELTELFSKLLMIAVVAVILFLFAFRKWF